MALQALGQITLLADGSLSPSQLRAAKPFSTRPNDNLQVRLALATDQKDVKGFYGLEYLRVQQAALYSRYASTKEWQRLGDSYYSGEDKDELTVPWNVEQIRFATDFVQVEQHAQRYKHKTGQTGSSLTKDEFRWQVKLPLKTLTGKQLSEYLPPLSDISMKRENRSELCPLPKHAIPLLALTARRNADS